MGSGACIGGYMPSGVCASNLDSMKRVRMRYCEAIIKTFVWLWDGNGVKGGRRTMREERWADGTCYLNGSWAT